jgi:hypothetical protein
MNSIGVRSWTASGLEALGIKSDEITPSHKIFHRHLHGTRTASVNFHRLAESLPAGTISQLRGEFPVLASQNQSNAKFLFAAMQEKLGEENPAPVLYHDRAIAHKPPSGVAKLFSLFTNGASRVASKTARPTQGLAKSASSIPTVRTNSTGAASTTSRPDASSATEIQSVATAPPDLSTVATLVFTEMNGDKFVFDTGSGTLELTSLSQLNTCKSLKNLALNNLPANVKSLDLSACSKLSSLECRWNDSLSSVKLGKSAVMSELCFQGCPNLREFTSSLGRGLRRFEGNGCPVFEGIKANIHMQTIVQNVENKNNLGDPQDSERRSMTQFSGVSAQIKFNDGDGTTTFSAPEPKKGFFGRLFGRK